MSPPAAIAIEPWTRATDTRNPHRLRGGVIRPTRTITAAVVLAALSAPGVATAGTGKNCAVSSTGVESIHVHRYTTSCAFGRKVANRLMTGPVSRADAKGSYFYLRSLNTGTTHKLRVERPNSSSYYVYDRRIEIAIDMGFVGG
jgi:hypothetical protein